MVYAKKRRTTGGKRRTYRRKRVYKSRKLTIKRNPFPLQTVARLKYVDQVSIDPALAGTNSHFFSANNIYDPNTTGVGHQPYGHDQYVALYNHYYVIKSSIKVTAVGGTVNSANGAAILGIAVKDDTTAETNYLTIMEAKGSHYRMMPTDQKVTVTNGYNARKMFPKVSAEELGAVVGTSPAEQAYYQVWINSPAATLDVGNLFCTVEIYYTVRFYELRDLGMS